MTEAGTGPAGGVESGGVDWAGLFAAAEAALEHAYAPYSGFRVGAAALVDDGRVVSGCNVENASYGLTLCAECSLVSALRMSGGGRLVAFVCVNGDGERIAPCGRCRQLLFEHAAPGMPVAAPETRGEAGAAAPIAPATLTIEQLLPGAFGPGDLAHEPRREDAR